MSHLLFRRSRSEKKHLHAVKHNTVPSGLIKYCRCPRFQQVFVKTFYFACRLRLAAKLIETSTSAWWERFPACTDRQPRMHPKCRAFRSCWTLFVQELATFRLQTSALVMIRYIENIDISFSISIYRIVSYRRKIYRIFRYIAISFVCHDIFDISQYFTPEVYIFTTVLPK